MKRKIALIVDIKNWAFYNIAKQVEINLSDSFDFKIIPLEEIEGNIIQCFILCKDCDLIHFFWRGYINLLDKSFAKDYSSSLGIKWKDFLKEYVYSKIITAGVYDHLFLEKEKNVTKSVLKFAKYYYTSSKKLFDIYFEKFIDNPPLMEITDGVDLKKFYPKNIDRFKKNNSDKFYIGWVGNSSWGGEDIDFKGVNTIIKPLIEELILEGYNVEPFFADRKISMVSHDEMVDYYSKIDLYLCASLAEGTPNPILESMACGVPIITTNVGIVEEVFGKKQREFIVINRDISSYKNKIKILLNNRDKLSSLSKENQEQIKKWAWQEKCKDFKIFFEESLK